MTSLPCQNEKIQQREEVGKWGEPQDNLHQTLLNPLVKRQLWNQTLVRVFVLVWSPQNDNVVCQRQQGHIEDDDDTMDDELLDVESVIRMTENRTRNDHRKLVTSQVPHTYVAVIFLQPQPPEQHDNQTSVLTRPQHPRQRRISEFRPQAPKGATAEIKKEPILSVKEQIALRNSMMKGASNATFRRIFVSSPTINHERASPLQKKLFFHSAPPKTTRATLSLPSFSNNDDDSHQLPESRNSQPLLIRRTKRGHNYYGSSSNRVSCGLEVRDSVDKFQPEEHANDNPAID